MELSCNPVEAVLLLLEDCLRAPFAGSTHPLLSYSDGGISRLGLGFIDGSHRLHDSGVHVPTTTDSPLDILFSGLSLRLGLLYPGVVPAPALGALTPLQLTLSARLRTFCISGVCRSDLPCLLLP